MRARQERSVMVGCVLLTLFPSFCSNLWCARGVGSLVVWFACGVLVPRIVV